MTRSILTTIRCEGGCGDWLVKYDAGTRTIKQSRSCRMHRVWTRGGDADMYDRPSEVDRWDIRCRKCGWRTTIPAPFPD